MRRTLKLHVPFIETNFPKIARYAHARVYPNCIEIFDDISLQTSLLPFSALK